MPESVILGNDESNHPLHLGDIERRSGLYILGKPGMGKSALIVNLLNSTLAIQEPTRCRPGKSRQAPSGN